MKPQKLATLKKIQKSDDETITNLYKKYNKALINGAFKKGLNSQEAEVVVQRTWSTLLEVAHNFQGRSHIRTYLFGIMYNKIKELYRENKKYSSYELIDETYRNLEEFESSSQPEKEFAHAQFVISLKSELTKYTETQRNAFVSYTILGENSSDTCRNLGLKRSHLGVMIHRMKKQLRTSLVDHANSSVQHSA